MALVVSNPSLTPAVVADRVTNQQIVPTVLSALGLDPLQLDAVRLENTQPLPGLGL